MRPASTNMTRAQDSILRDHNTEISNGPDTLLPSIPKALLWLFMATALLVFLMVFTGRIIGDEAGYCLVTVIVAGFVLFRSCDQQDQA